MVGTLCSSSVVRSNEKQVYDHSPSLADRVVLRRDVYCEEEVCRHLYRAMID